MSQAPNLLNDDGTASIATALMSSHHAFRRDLARFAHALAKVEKGDGSRIEALREEWENFRGALHGHHEAEDQGIFPDIASKHAATRGTIERLTADHHRIDPLLERGDAAFAGLPDTAPAVTLLHELEELLGPHLATEEREIIPFLRETKAFPPPPNDEVAAMYAGGFAWSLHGLAADVVDKLCAMFPASVLERLPAARAAFTARCERVWGTAKAGGARTPLPDAIDD